VLYFPQCGLLCAPKEMTNEHTDKRFNPDDLRDFYKRARNRLWKLEPTSVLAHSVNILHKASYGGIDIMRTYRPWDVLLMVRWTLQTIDPTAHRRPPATLNDVHKVLNIIHEMGAHVRMPTEYEHVYLFMRHLAYQQFWLQHQADGASIARQELLFCRLPKDHSFQRDFFRLTGLRCAEFAELAFSLMAFFLTDQKRKAVRRSHFSNLEPRFSVKSLDSFLAALSLNLAEAQAFLSSNEEKERSISDQIILPTTLQNFPLWRHGEDFIAYSPTLLFRSLEDFIYRRLKREDKTKFSERFGPIFEQYVADQMTEAGVAYVRESDLNDILLGTGKCVDFLTVDNDCNILIDAKGVEISQAGLLSHRAEIVFGSIKNSAGKAIKQGNETARRIAAAPPTSSIAFGKRENYLFVVTFDSLHLGSNTEFEPMFGTRLMDSLNRDFGQPLPIPLTNVFFLTIDEFECLLSAIQAGETSFVAAAKRAQQNDGDNRTRKFSFIQHLVELSPQVKRLPSMQKALDDLCDRASSNLRKEN
jgi:hypothetical protein